MVNSSCGFNIMLYLCNLNWVHFGWNKVYANWKWILECQHHTINDFVWNNKGILKWSNVPIGIGSVKHLVGHWPSEKKHKNNSFITNGYTPQRPILVQLYFLSDIIIKIESVKLCDLINWTHKTYTNDCRLYKYCVMSHPSSSYHTVYYSIWYKKIIRHCEYDIISDRCFCLFNVKVIYTKVNTNTKQSTQCVV